MDSQDFADSNPTLTLKQAERLLKRLGYEEPDDILREQLWMNGECNTLALLMTVGY